MNKVINNHIQISKLLLRPFSHKTNDGMKAHYLDFKDFEIHEEKIKILGTRPEYYYPQTENFLAKDVETKVGDCFKLLRDVAEKEIPFEISSENLESIKTFFGYNFLRSEGVRRETKKKGVHFQFLSDKDQTELIIKHPEPALKLFDNTFANIIINKSTLDFVIPHNCIYSAEFTIKPNLEIVTVWCMPISPKCCVILVPNEHIGKFKQNDMLMGLKITSSEIVESYNNRALASENTYSKNFIVGDYQELCRLATVLKKLQAESAKQL